MIDPASIEEYIAAGGYAALTQALRSVTPMDLCKMVEASGLRGRGGGGFPTGKKWQFALNTESDQRYDVIVDMVGNHSVGRNQRVLEPDGRLVIVGGPKGNWIAPLKRPLGALLRSLFASQEMSMML